jgi:hypothetical protein
MSRTLTIIILDFFIMVSVCFFIFQFVQSDRAAAKSAAKASQVVLTITPDKSRFLTGSQIPTKRLLDLAFAIQIDGKVIPEADLRILPSYDSTFIVYLGAQTGAVTVSIFPRRVHSIEYVLTKPTIKVAISGPGNHVRLETITTDFAHEPVAVVSLN